MSQRIGVRPTNLLVNGTLTNFGPGNVYYGDDESITLALNDGSLAQGDSVHLDGSQWVLSDSLAYVDVVPSAIDGGGGGGSGIDTSTWHSGDTGVFDGSAIVRAKKLRISLGDPPYVVSTDDTALTATGSSYVTNVDAIQAALNTLATTGGELVFPKGTVRLQKTGTLGITHPVNAPPIRYCGMRRGLSIVRLTGVTPTFILAASASSTGDDTFRGLTIEDLSIDGGNANRINQGVIFQARGTMSYANIAIRRVRSYNGGAFDTGGQGGRHIIMQSTCNTMFGTVPARSDPFTVNNVVFEDLDLEGGNFGITCFAFLQGAAGEFNKAARIRWNNGGTGKPAAYVLFDNVFCTRVNWDSEATLTGAPVTSGGIQIVGDGSGGKIHLRDCTVKGSGDIGIEIESTLDLLIDGCTEENCVTAGIFVTANHGGMPFINRHTIRIVNNRSRRTDSAFGGMGSVTTAVRNGSAFGTLILDNCTMEHTCADHRAQDGSFTAVSAFQIEGPIRNVNMRNCGASYTGMSHDAEIDNESTDVIGILFRPVGTPMNITVDNFWFEMDDFAYRGGAHTGCTIDVTPIKWAACSRATIRIRNQSTSIRRNNSSNYQIRLRDHRHSATDDTSTIKTDTLNAFTYDFIFDEGASSDIGLTSNLFTSLANHTTRKRTRWPGQSYSGNVAGTSILEQQDVGGTVKLTPGPTLSGVEAGWVARSNRTGSQLLMGYLVDDGTKSMLKVIKMVGGTPTELASQDCSTRISNGQLFAVKTTVLGDVVTVDYYADGTSPSGLTGTGSETLTHTLSSANGVLFSYAGMVGPMWTFADAAATLAMVRMYRGSYIKDFLLDGYIVNHDDTTFTNNAIYLADMGTGRHRIGNKMRFKNVDLSGLRKMAGTDFTLPSATGLKAKISVESSNWSNTPPSVTSSITPSGSPYVYQNTDGYDEYVTVTSGTVSAVDISPDGTTYASVGATAGMWRLPAGWYLKATYTVAPTMSKIPLHSA